MARALSYFPAARSDLRQVDWERQAGSPDATRRRLRALTSAIDRLEDAPCLWRPREEGARPVIAGRYRVMYRVSPDTNDNATAGDVLIIRILGPGQTS